MRTPGAFKLWVNCIQLAQPHQALGYILCRSSTCFARSVAVQVEYENAISETRISHFRLKG
jgi:hypothetical protein